MSTLLPQRIQIEPNDSVSLELLGSVTFDPGCDGAPHAHPFWELLLVRGAATFSDTAGNKVLETGELCLIPPSHRHCFTNAGGDSLGLVYIGFSFTLDPESSLPRDLPIVVSPLLRHTPIPAKLRVLAEALEETGEAAVLKYRNQALEIVLELLDVLLTDAVDAPPQTRQTRLVEKAKSYLRQNVDRTVTVEEMAGIFYLSPHYFGELFKAETGVSLKAYHRALRLHQAAHLLTTTDRTVTQIADDLGFDSLHTFSRLFTAHHGQSPRVFRKTLNLFRRSANDISVSSGL